MKKIGFWLFGAMIIFACGVAGYIWQINAPEHSQSQSVKEHSLGIAIRYPVAKASGANEEKHEGAEVASAPSSSSTLLQELARLFGEERLNSLFNVNEIVRNFVVTVVNATDQQLPRRTSIYKPLPDDFVVDQIGDGPVLDEKSYVRYSKYIYLLKQVDSTKLVRVYARYYPLFEQAYRELGLDGYFNDRLVEVVDNALSTPEENGTVKLIHTGYYKFADPQLESLSAAQKLLIRIGPANETIVKNKLRQIRSLLTHLDKT